MPINNRTDYRREIEMRVANNSTDSDMIIEGRAIVFNERTVLFEIDDQDYGEIIDGEALTNTRMNNLFFKFNHNDSVMPVARYKNGTLELDVRSDGVWIKARLANTQAGRDLYTLVQRGDIDKMSFAFTIAEESYNKDTRTWTVRKIKELYDVAAVTVPAYESTSLYARRKGDVEALRLKDVETSRLELTKRKALALVGLKNKLQ